MQKKALQQNLKYTPSLYNVVFESTLVKYAVFGLLAFLLFQPVAPAFAAIDESNQQNDVAVIEDDINEQEEENLPTLEAEVEISDSEEQATDADESFDANATQEIANEVDIDRMVEEEIKPSESSDVAVATVAIDEVQIGKNSETDEAVEQNDVDETTVSFENETNVSDSDSLPSEGGESEVDFTVSTSTSNTVQDSSEITFEIATATDSLAASSTDLIAQEQAEEVLVIIPEEEALPQVPKEATTTASTTQAEISTSTTEVAIVQHNSTAFAFNTDECAIVGDGAYYCSSTKEADEVFKDGVFAAPDSDGDLEIYVRLNGEERQFTTNTYDDSAPYYDALSQRIVWHALIDDRYQIFTNDINGDKKTQLTSTSYNNMEPVAYGDITLWQAWVNDNWEIMMFDGEKTQQLTNNTMQDVSPHMREGYIVWQTQFEDGWQVAVYDQKTKNIEYIPSEGGLKVENPRFVLVYDSTDDNGDIQTVGYDFDKKVTFTLGNIPAELPDELPDPDQTGETRALIQNKQTSKEGESEVVDGPIPNPNNNGTSTSEFGTLDLSQGAGEISATSSIVTEISDVVVPVYAASSTENQQTTSNIEDLVIPPLVGTSTEEVS